MREDLVHETAADQHEAQKQLFSRARAQYKRLRAKVQEVTKHNNDINATFANGQANETHLKIKHLRHHKSLISGTPRTYVASKLKTQSTKIQWSLKPN